MRKDRITLEYHADVAFMRGQIVDRLPIELDHAALDGVEPRDHPQERRLAAARRSQKCEKLTVFYLLREPRNNRNISVTLHHIFDLYRYTHSVSHLLSSCPVHRQEFSVNHDKYRHKRIHRLL